MSEQSPKREIYCLKNLRYKLFLIAFFYFSFLSANNFFFSPSYRLVEFESPVPDSIFFDEINIIPGSFELSAYMAEAGDTLQVLSLGDDYVSEKFTYDIKSNDRYACYILINNPERFRFLRIVYNVFPEKYFQRYSIYKPLEISDSLNVRAIRRTWDSFLLDNQGLNITGSKTISVSVSNQDNVDINQSLFLKIDGELSPNVMIQAQLNDSQSPLSSEGDSKELSSLDEVFFKVYGRQYEVAFGDLDMQMKNTRFLNYKPKFEGLKLSYFEKQQASFAIALSRANPATVIFNGVEGKQGPYYLKPAGIHTNVKILPGSETIWLNGLRIDRGSDYRIDYNDGSVEFYLKHFISENSRIQASFQYTDEYYRKNTYLANSSYYIGDRLKLDFAGVYQKDDKDKPLLENLSETDIEMLRQAGDSIPYISGESFVGEGHGLYRKTLIDSLEVFIFDPGSDFSDYNVYFTWVGYGNGDYIQVSPSRFDYVGNGLGQWLPIREIKAPKLMTNYNFSLSYFYDFFELNYETLLSEYDKNTFSNLDNDDNFSHIQHIEGVIRPDWDNFSPELKTYYRFTKRNLFTFAEIRDSEDSFNFGTFTKADSLSSDEYFIGLKTLSYNFLNQETSFKKTVFEKIIYQNYLHLTQSIRQTRYSPSVIYRLRFAEEDNKYSQQETRIRVQEPALRYNYKSMTFNSKSRHTQNKVLDKSKNKYISGNRYNYYFNSLAFDKVYNSGIMFSYEFDNNDYFFNHWQKNRESYTFSVQSYTQLDNHYFTGLYSHRQIKSFTENSQDQTFDIAEIRTMNNFLQSAIRFNSNYIIKNLEFYPKSRELRYIGQGAGLYDSTGTWTEGGDYDWVSVTVGEPSKSIEVQAFFNLYAYPGQIKKFDNEFLKKINLETNIAIIEQTDSSDRLRVYFLYPSTLMSSNSIYSRQEFRQVVWYNILRNKWISRYTFKNDKILDNRYQSSEESLMFEHEFSLRLMRYLNTDYEKIFSFMKEKDSRYDMQSTLYNNKLELRTSFTHNLIFTTGFGLQRENVISRNQEQLINRYIFSEDIMAFLGNKYRINSNFEIKYNKIKTPITSYLPFDKQKGANMRWSLGFNYLLNRISNLNLSYSGYKYPGQEAFHQVKMEIRAEF